MPSETVTATRLRTCSGCLPNQSSARAQALAAFSRKTGRPTTDSSMARRSMAGQPRFGANIRCPCASTRPGRLTPTPSTRVAGNWARSATTVSASRAAKASGVAGVFHCSWALNCASRPARPTVVSSGRSSTPMVPTRSVLTCRKRGRRPRGRSPSSPSLTQPSTISSSMMAETVLRCRPDRLARSARDSGSCRRIRLSAIRRLIWRAVSLVATWKLVRSILRMLI